MTPNAKAYIMTRGLPKTGQVISYAAGDDGDLQKGWNRGERFKFFTAGGAALALDRATGLVWPQNGASPGGNNGGALTWVNALAYANGLTWGGFSDWRLPNRLELASMINNAAGSSGWQAGFAWPPYGYVWTSTTYLFATTYALAIDNSTKRFTANLKTGTCGLLCCRGGTY